MARGPPPCRQEVVRRHRAPMTLGPGDERTYVTSSIRHERTHRSLQIRASVAALNAARQGVLQVPLPEWR